MDTLTVAGSAVFSSNVSIAGQLSATATTVGTNMTVTGSAVITGTASATSAVIGTLSATTINSSGTSTLGTANCTTANLGTATATVATVSSLAIADTCTSARLETTTSHTSMADFTFVTSGPTYTMTPESILAGKIVYTGTGTLDVTLPTKASINALLSSSVNTRTWTIMIFNSGTGAMTLTTPGGSYTVSGPNVIAPNTGFELIVALPPTASGSGYSVYMLGNLSSTPVYDTLTVSGNTSVTGNLSVTGTATVGSVQLDGVTAPLVWDNVEFDTGGQLGTSGTPIAGGTVTINTETCKNPIIELDTGTTPLTINLTPTPGGGLVSAQSVGRSFFITLVERGAGRALTFDSRFKWPGTTAPTITTTTANVINVTNVKTDLVIANMNFTGGNGGGGGTPAPGASNKLYGYDMSRNSIESSTKLIANTADNSIYVMGDVRAPTERRVDPPLATTSIGGARYGASLAMSVDGNWKAVGVPGAYNPGLGLATGALFVYNMVNGAWNLHTSLYPTSPLSLAFGTKVVMNNTTLVVSAPNEVVQNITGHGVVYVYELANNVWGFKTTLATPKLMHYNALIGSALSITLNTETLNVIAVSVNSAGVDASDIFFYELTAGVWGAPIPWKSDLTNSNDLTYVTGITLYDKGARCGVSFGGSTSTSPTYTVITRGASWSSLSNWAVTGNYGYTTLSSAMGWTDSNNTTIGVTVNNQAQTTLFKTSSITTNGGIGSTPNVERGRGAFGIYRNSVDLFFVWGTPSSQASTGDYNMVWSSGRGRAASTINCMGLGKGSLPFILETKTTGKLWSGYLATVALGIDPQSYVLDVAYASTAPTLCCSASTATAWDWYVVYDGYGYETFLNMDGSASVNGDLCRTAFQGTRGYYVAKWNHLGQFVCASLVYRPYSNISSSYQNPNSPNVARFQVVGANAASSKMLLTIMGYLDNTSGGRAYTYSLHDRSLQLNAGPYNDVSGGRTGFSLIGYSFNITDAVFNGCTAFIQFGSGRAYSTDYCTTLLSFDVAYHYSSINFLCKYLAYTAPGTYSGIKILATRNPLLPSDTPVAVSCATIFGQIDNTTSASGGIASLMMGAAQANTTVSIPADYYHDYVAVVGVCFPISMVPDAGSNTRCRCSHTMQTSATPPTTGHGNSVFAMTSRKVAGQPLLTCTLSTQYRVNASSDTMAYTGVLYANANAGSSSGYKMIGATRPYSSNAQFLYITSVSPRVNDFPWLSSETTTTGGEATGYSLYAAESYDVGLISGARSFWDGNDVYGGDTVLGYTYCPTGVLGGPYSNYNKLPMISTSVFTAATWGTLTGLAGVTIIAWTPYNTIGVFYPPSLYNMKNVTSKLSYSVSRMAVVSATNGQSTEVILPIDRYSTSRGWMSTANTNVLQPYMQTANDTDAFSWVSTAPVITLPDYRVRPVINNLISNFDKLNSASVPKGGFLNTPGIATGAVFIAWGSMNTDNADRTVAWGDATTTFRGMGAICFLHSTGNVGGALRAGYLLSAQVRCDGYVFDANSDTAGNLYVLFTVYGPLGNLLNFDGSVSSTPLRVPSGMATVLRPQLIIASWSPTGVCRGGTVVYTNNNGHEYSMQDNGRLVVTATNVCVLFNWTQALALNLWSTTGASTDNLAVQAGTLTVDTIGSDGLVMVRYSQSAFAYVDATLLISTSMTLSTSKHPVCPTTCVGVGYHLGSDTMYVARAYYSGASNPGNIITRNVGSGTNITTASSAYAPTGYCTLAANTYHLVLFAWVAGTAQAPRSIAYNNLTMNTSYPQSFDAPLVAVSPNGTDVWIAYTVNQYKASNEDINVRNGASTSFDPPVYTADHDAANNYTYTHVMRLTNASGPSVWVADARLLDTDKKADGMITPTAIMATDTYAFVAGCTIGVTLKLRTGATVISPANPMNTRDRYITYVASIARACDAGYLTYQNTIAATGTTNQTPLLMVNSAGYPDIIYQMNGYSGSSVIRLLDGVATATTYPSGGATVPGDDLSMYRIANSGFSSLDTTNTKLAISDVVTKSLVPSGSSTLAAAYKVVNTFMCTTLDEKFVINVFTYSGSPPPITTNLHKLATAPTFISTPTECYRVGCVVYSVDGKVMCGATILETASSTVFRNSIYASGVTALPGGQFAIGMNYIAASKSGGVYTAYTYQYRNLSGMNPQPITTEVNSLNTLSYGQPNNSGFALYNLASDGLSGTCSLAAPHLVWYSYMNTTATDETSLGNMTWSPFHSSMVSRPMNNGGNGTAAYRSCGNRGSHITYKDGILYLSTYIKSIYEFYAELAGMAGQFAKYRSTYPTSGTWSFLPSQNISETDLARTNNSYKNGDMSVVLCINIRGSNQIVMPITLSHVMVDSSSVSHMAHTTGFMLPDTHKSSSRVHFLTAMSMDYTGNSIVTEPKFKARYNGNIVASTNTVLGSSGSNIGKGFTFLFTLGSQSDNQPSVGHWTVDSPQQYNSIGYAPFLVSTTPGNTQKVSSELIRAACPGAALVSLEDYQTTTHTCMDFMADFQNTTLTRCLALVTFKVCTVTYGGILMRTHPHNTYPICMCRSDTYYYILCHLEPGVTYELCNADNTNNATNLATTITIGSSSTLIATPYVLVYTLSGKYAYSFPLFDLTTSSVYSMETYNCNGCSIHFAGGNLHIDYAGGVWATSSVSTPAVTVPHTGHVIASASLTTSQRMHLILPLEQTSRAVSLTLTPNGSVAKSTVVAAIPGVSTAVGATVDAAGNLMLARPSAIERRPMAANVTSAVDVISIGEGTIYLGSGGGWGSSMTSSGDNVSIGQPVTLVGTQPIGKLSDFTNVAMLPFEPTTLAPRMTVLSASSQMLVSPSIALSADGNLAAVGCPNEDVDGRGAVYIYQRNTTTGEWSQLAILKNKTGGVLDTAASRFGTSVCMSWDGKVIMVYDPNYQTSGLTGIITAFVVSTVSEWGTLVNNRTGHVGVGWPSTLKGYPNISLSGDGCTLFIPLHNNTYSNGVYCLTYRVATQAGWTSFSTGTTGPGGGAGESTDNVASLAFFVHDTDISYNGRMILLGYEWNNSTSAYPFYSRYLDNTPAWATGLPPVLAAQDIPTKKTNAFMGITKSLIKSTDSAVDGMRALVGSLRQLWYIDRASATTGWVSTYTEITLPTSFLGHGPVCYLGTNFLIAGPAGPQKQLRLFDGTSFTQIASYDGIYEGHEKLTIAPAGDGKSFMVCNGNASQTVGHNFTLGKSSGDAFYSTSNNVGAVTFAAYRPSPGTDTPQVTRNFDTLPPGVNVKHGQSIALSADSRVLLVGAPDTTITSYTSKGAAYVYSRRGNSWATSPVLFHPADTLCVDFGASVAVSPDGLRVFVGDPLYNSGAGAVFYAAWTESTRTLGTIFKWTVASSVSLGTSLSCEMGTSAGGYTLATGAPSTTVSSFANAGCIYVNNNYTFGSSMTTVAFTINHSSPSANANFGRLVQVHTNQQLAVSNQQYKIIGSSDTGPAMSWYSNNGTPTVGTTSLMPSSATNVVDLKALTAASTTIHYAVYSTSSGTFIATCPYNANTWTLAYTLSNPFGIAMTGPVAISTKTAWASNVTENKLYAFKVTTGAYVDTINPTSTKRLAINYWGDVIATANPDLVSTIYSGEVYTMTTMPVVGATPTATITAPITNSLYSAVAARFGSAVSMSNCGSVALVGADNGLSNNDGLAYIYTRQGENWVHYQTLDPADTACVNYGASVAINSAGTIAVVGDPDYTGGGAVFVWTNVGGVWGSMAKLTVASSTSFGTSVAISGDGTRIAVGDLVTNGRVLIYDKPGGTYSTSSTPSATLTPTVTSGALVGTSVALNLDGSILAAGAPGYNGTAMTASGAVVTWINNGSWSAAAIIEAATPVNGDNFGRRVSLSRHLNTTVVLGVCSTSKGYRLAKTDGANAYAASTLLATGDAGVLNGNVVVAGTNLYFGATAFDSNKGKIYRYNAAGSITGTYLGDVGNSSFGNVFTVDPKDTVLAIGEPVASDPSNVSNVGRLRIRTTLDNTTTMVTRTAANPPTTPTVSTTVDSGDSWTTGWSSGGSVLYNLKAGVYNADGYVNSSGMVKCGHYDSTSSRTYINAAAQSAASGLPSTTLPAVGCYCLANTSGTTFTFGTLLPTTSHANSWTKFTCCAGDSSTYFLGGVINNTTAATNKIGENNTVLIGPALVDVGITGVNQAAVISRIDSTGSPLGQWTSYIRSSAIGVSITPRFITATGMVVVDVTNPGGGIVTVTGYSNPASPVTGPSAQISLTAGVVLFHINLTNGTWLSAISVNGTPNTTNAVGLMRVYALGAANSVALVHVENGGSRPDVVTPTIPGGVLNVYPQGVSTPVTNVCRYTNAAAIFANTAGAVLNLIQYSGAFVRYPNINAVAARSADLALTLHNGGTVIYRRSNTTESIVQTINRAVATTTACEPVSIVLLNDSTYYRHFIVSDDDDNAGVRAAVSVNSSDLFVLCAEFRAGETSTSTTVATYNDATVTSSVTVPANSSNTIVLTGSAGLTWSLT